MKIGQSVTIKDDFKINTSMGNNLITIKEGDEGFLNSDGYLNMTTGKGADEIIKINNINLSGYDHENISKLIFTRLNAVFGLECYMDCEKIEIDEFIEEIEDVLAEIL